MEPDRTRWRGIQPVHGIAGVWPARDAVRVWERGNQPDEGTAIIYTVPANKMLYLATAFFASVTSHAQGGAGNMFIRDENDATVQYFYNHLYKEPGQMSNGLRYFPALEAEADWDVCVASGNDSMQAWGVITGWLEDA